jgi:CelD/BcsL family acetyltransferase involved in cellulose biosynthesis
MNITLHRPDELTADIIAAWERLQQSHPAYRSPYFHPQFTQCVAAVRDDVEVAVLGDGTETQGVFPFQRGPGRGEGRPVGGRMSDFHGVLLAPGTNVSLDALMTGCRLRSFAFDHLIVANQPFETAGWTTAASPFLDFTNGFDAYRAERNKSGTEEIKQTERKLRKFEREVGPLRFEFHTEDRAVFETLLAWKSQQYRDTGLTDVFFFPWTVRLLEQILQRQGDEFGGILSSLHAGDRLVAMHYGMRCRDVLHSWFPAYDRDFYKYSPGMLLLYKLAEACPARGITRLDLGKGTEQYKVNLASGTDLVAEGSVDRSVVSRTVRRFWNGARSLVKSSPRLRAAIETPLRLVRPLREKKAFR